MAVEVLHKYCCPTQWCSLVPWQWSWHWWRVLSFSWVEHLEDQTYWDWAPEESHWQTDRSSDILGLSTWRVNDIQTTQRQMCLQRDLNEYHLSVSLPACLTCRFLIGAEGGKSSVIRHNSYLVCGAEVWDWLKGMGRTSLLLPLWLKTDFDWLIRETDWERERDRRVNRETDMWTHVSPGIGLQMFGCWPLLICYMFTYLHVLTVNDRKRTTHKTFIVEVQSVSCSVASTHEPVNTCGCYT